MSLFSTIAHPDVPETRRLSLRGVGMVAAGVALGIAIGFFIADSRSADLSEQVAAISTSSEFFRLNTSEMPHWSPAAPAVVVPAQHADWFDNINTTAYDGLVPGEGTARAGEPSETFLELNIGSLEYAGPGYAERPGNPR